MNSPIHNARWLRKVCFQSIPGTCASPMDSLGRRSKPVGVLTSKYFIVAFAGFLIAAASFPSYAADRAGRGGRASRYDGTWSVLLETTRGDCTPALRASLRIAGGRLLAEDQSYRLDGQVGQSGAVRVAVSANGQSALGFGHLSLRAGLGRWRTELGECVGRWSAERRDILLGQE